MKISQYEIWLANLNPSKGTEPGKVRPVVVVQTNLLNDIHLSTLICPITTNVLPDVKILRVALTKKQLDEKSDILVDQLRAIDNKRFIKKLGMLTKEQIMSLKENLRIVLELWNPKDLLENLRFYSYCVIRTRLWLNSRRHSPKAFVQRTFAKGILTFS